MKHKILSLLIVAVAIFSFGQSAYAGAVTIPDAKLSNALHDILGVPYNQQITTEQLAGLTGDVNLSGYGISDMDGVQYLTGASSIDLSLNTIGSIPREIENLTSLESLDISGNKLTRIPSNIGNLSSLKSLDIRANRLEELTSALKKLSLDTFKCDYNFLNVSAGSSDRSIIDGIGAANKYFQDQLVTVKNLSAYSPQNGTIVLYWDEMGSIRFDNGVIGEIDRFVVLDSGYNYKGQASAQKKSYEISGLDTTTEYTFYVGADYYVKGTKYDGTYVKAYRSVTLKAVPQNTPTMTLTPSDTPTATPEPETPTPAPETPTPAPETPTPVPQTAVPGPPPEKTGGGLNTIYIVLIVLIALFVLLTLFIIMRAVGQKRNSNTRYRR